MGKKSVGRKGKSKDEASRKENRSENKKGNNGEKDKDGMNSGGSERVLRSRSVPKGRPDANEKAKGMKPMVEGNLNRGDANADEKTRKKTLRIGGNLKINEEVAQKGSGNEKGKKVSGDRDWILKPHNPRQGDRKISEKAKGKRKVVAEEENDEGPVSPAKRKKRDRITDPNASSAGRGAYNLRARKADPSFQRLGLSETGFGLVVGKRVKVYKSGSREWVTGTIKSYDDTEKLHNVVYVDGESEELDLKSQRFEVEVMPGEASTLCAKQKPNVNPKSWKTKKTDSDVRSDDLNVEMEKSFEESDDENADISEVEKLVTNAGKKSARDGASASKSKRSKKMKKDEGEDKESSEEGAINSDSSK